MFVVAVFSIKRPWLDTHPKAKKLRIRVLPKEPFSRIENGERPDEVLTRKYKRWLNEEGFYEHEKEVDAWECAIAVRGRLNESNRPADLSFGNSNRRIYVFEMQPSVWERRKFADMNSELRDKAKSTCVYVGQTSKAPAERYDAHIDEDHNASTVWGEQYFLRPFERADRSDLVKSYRESGFATEGLNQYEALKAELTLRRWLQKRGIAAYSA